MPLYNALQVMLIAAADAEADANADDSVDRRLTL